MTLLTPKGRQGHLAWLTWSSVVSTLGSVGNGIHRSEVAYSTPVVFLSPNPSTAVRCQAEAAC